MLELGYCVWENYCRKKYCREIWVKKTDGNPHFSTLLNIENPVVQIIHRSFFWRSETSFNPSIRFFLKLPIIVFRNNHFPIRQMYEKTDIAYNFFQYYISKLHRSLKNKQKLSMYWKKTIAWQFFTDYTDLIETSAIRTYIQ